VGDAVLRPLREADLEAVCAIETASFSTPWSRPLFAAELQRPEICHWLALEDPAVPGGIAAYGGFWKAVDEAHFTNIAVHPQARRRGLGRRLLRALLDLAKERGCVRATLEVRPSNTAAVALYESEGFSAAALRPRYYSDDGEDALLLWKQAL
jgi:ribosomal-protein-alanine N-acetyltransferase